MIKKIILFATFSMMSTTQSMQKLYPHTQLGKIGLGIGVVSVVGGIGSYILLPHLLDSHIKTKNYGGGILKGVFIGSTQGITACAALFGVAIGTTMYLTAQLTRP